MRIVSLLPSTTEILYSIGAGPQVVGVTFECDFPVEARSSTIVSSTTMPEGLPPRAIDQWVSSARERGEDLYRLDEDALADLDADLVITQDLCAVCAVDVSAVADALDHLGCRAEVLTIDPHTLDEVWDSIVTVGRATGHEGAAAELVASLRERLSAVERRVAGRTRPRVMLLEWMDPPFAPGHWIPAMIESAGGEPLLGASGSASRRTTWEAIIEASPEVVVAAPCGFDRAGAADQIRSLRAANVLSPAIPMHPADANASWARPGPRLMDGIEELAAILHPPHPSDRSLPL